MKNSVIAFSVASVLVTSLTVFVFKTGIVAALTATSTSATSTDADPVIALSDSASSIPSSTASSPAAEAVTASTSATSTTVGPFTDNATSTTSSATSSASHAQDQGSSQGASSVKSKPALKRVHVVGSKYVDFFTDGTTIFSFPGDSLIDANLNKPDAPIPTHVGLTWVSSKGIEAYDTPTGDLEAGTYAQEANGSFIADDSESPASATSTIHVRFSLLDPTLDTSAPPPAPKVTDASISHSPAHPAAPDTASTTSSLPDTSAAASSTPETSTATSASSTAASVASTTPTIASATSTATSTAISSSVASSTSAAASDNTASTTAATSTAQ